MKLRPLEIRDAEPMLECMHDNFVVEKLQTKFVAKTMNDCIAFSKNSLMLTYGIKFPSRRLNHNGNK